MLLFRGALSHHFGGTFSRSVKKYKVTKVTCRGTEISLNDCEISTWGDASCAVDREAGVACDTGRQ